MTRSMLFAAAALATLTSGVVAPSTANAGIGSLGECYNTVITWCNNTHPEHASECASSAMDECDDAFANAVPGMSIDRIVTQPHKGKYKLKLIKASRKPVLKRGDDGSYDGNDAGNGRDSSRDTGRDTGRDSGRDTGRTAGR